MYEKETLNLVLVVLGVALLAAWFLPAYERAKKEVEG